MSINAYEEIFCYYPTQAIVCTLKNFIDYNDNYDNNNLPFDLKNDITKILLNGINYFKKNYAIKVYDAEIDINKIKNIANITIDDDIISTLKYLNKYKVLLVGSMYGNIYFINVEQNKCFHQIEAHRPYEVMGRNWGVIYINEIEGNRLITSSGDTSMKLWEILEKSNENNNLSIDIKYISTIIGHTDNVTKVIQLKNNNKLNNRIKLVSCSFDGCIGFWEEKTKNKFELLKMIKSHEHWIFEIHEIFDGRVFVVGDNLDPYLKIWNPKNYTYELISNKIGCANHDCILEINKDYYLIGAVSSLLMFRLSGKMIIRVILINSHLINCLILLSDGKVIADSGVNKIKYADIGNYKVKDAIKTKEEINWYMQHLNNRKFAFSDPHCIKIWEY